MPEQTINLRIPDGLDRLLVKHFRAADSDDIPMNDEIRRAYIVSILAAVVEGLRAPVLADALVRLNGGYVLRSTNNDAPPH